MGLLTRLRKLLGVAPPVEGWSYVGITNRFMCRHTWTDGREKVHVYWKDGAGHHSGFVVESELPSTAQADERQITNGFARNINEALVLADMYMSDERRSPAAFMHSDTAEDDYGPSDSIVRQDTWLAEHAADYTFDVVEPDDVK